MGHHLNMITLGVHDKRRARAFYEALGWQGTGGGSEGPIFFDAHGTVVALWERASLAEDSCVPDTGGWGGVTLARCVSSREEVDTVTEKARAAGATIGRGPAETFWGGYSAIVIDPDGHPWEIAHNPHWALAEDGALSLG